MFSQEENPNWVFDFSMIDNISLPGGDLPPIQPDFQWTCDDLSVSNSLSVDVSDSSNLDANKTCGGSKKRARSGSCSAASDSKASKEKKRRDNLNIKFQELSSILDPERVPKTDKAAILDDAVRTLTQLRNETQELKVSCDSLQEQINELKAEKNELREDKQKLKQEKKKLEQKVKSLSNQPSFMPHPSAAIPPPYAAAAPGHIVGGKMVPFVGYPGMSMWQFMPPTQYDTSQDHTLRPPVA